MKNGAISEHVGNGFLWLRHTTAARVCHLGNGN